MSAQELQVRVVIAQGEAALRDALLDALEPLRTVVVCGAVSTYPALAELLQQAWPDVLVQGERVAGKRAPEVTRAVRAQWPQLPILYLAAPNADSALTAAVLRAGAQISLPSEVPPLQLVSELLRLQSDDYVRELARQRDALGGIPDLTQREAAVLECLLAGDTLAEAAETLGVGERMVATHVRHLRQKFAADDVEQLIATAKVLWQRYFQGV